MKAVMLAAGKSTRTYPLTLTRPKPLLKVANKTLIEHNLDQLKGLVKEAIIIVGYKREMIQEMLGDTYAGIKISYIIQDEQLGTGHALQLAKKQLDGKFIVMNGDDLFAHEDIKSCIKEEFCVLAKKVKDISRFGAILEEQGNMTELLEKPKKQVSDLANTGLYVFDTSIFVHELKKSARGELELVDYVRYLIDKGEVVKVKVAKNYWFPIGYPWDLLDANSILVESLKRSEIHGNVDKTVTIRGNVVVGKGTNVLAGTYIEGNVIIGEDCKIGPNCYLRGNTSIGDGCHVGQAVEIKNSILGDRSKVPHLSYVGDTVIGNDSNLGAGTITANLRHDGANIKSMVKGDLIDSGRRKFGAIIGDEVHTGINTCIYPGRKLWPRTSTLPGESVKKDLIGE